MKANTLTSGFHDLSPRERLAALLDRGEFRELVGPFDRISSPWLRPQGRVAQSDDGVIVARGCMNGHQVLAIAIEPAFEGGSIGEVGGAKIATALELALESSLAGEPIAALLLLETGGVRLQEANLGLAAIASIQTAIVALREWVHVIAVIAGPAGCFGGMSLVAALCTSIIGTSHGRFGMNGPEVIEQEAGPAELDASDRELIWQIFGCAARFRDGFIDTLVLDQSDAIGAAIQCVLEHPPEPPRRLAHPERQLGLLQAAHASAFPADVPQPPSRGRIWLDVLSCKRDDCHMTPSVLSAHVDLGHEVALAIAIVPDPASAYARAAHGELGLEQAMALAATIRRFVAEQEGNPIRRPILAIVDTPGQAYGRIEEQSCISVAAACAVDAYAAARSAGHPVITLVVGRAVSGSFLAHGLQTDQILALHDPGVSMCAMSPASAARITRRSLEDVLDVAKMVLPASYDIFDAHQLGIVDTLIPCRSAWEPDQADTVRVRDAICHALSEIRSRRHPHPAIDANVTRQATVAVRRAMREQWL